MGIQQEQRESSKSFKVRDYDQSKKRFTESVLFKQQLELTTKEFLKIVLLSLKPTINNLCFPLAFSWSFGFYSFRGYSLIHIFKLSITDGAEYLDQVLTWTLSNILKEDTAALVTMTKRCFHGWPG